MVKNKMFDDYVLENLLNRVSAKFPKKITEKVYNLLYEVYVVQPHNWVKTGKW